MADFLIPDWPVPDNVRALQTLRTGGGSPAPWNSFNLGDHVGDEAARVAANRALLRALLPAEPCWLRQVHGISVVDAASASVGVEADAACSRVAGAVCVVMTADCLPVLFCNRQGTVVAAVHAGWRGLLAGVLENTLATMQCPAGDVLAWLGPAIGPENFEVGDEVRSAFVKVDAGAEVAFQSQGQGKWLADLYALARRRLSAAGVVGVYGGGLCTVADGERFFSYRRDGVTGRQGSLIWLD
jgi:polyphenol oxidase